MTLVKTTQKSSEILTGFLFVISFLSLFAFCQFVSHMRLLYHRLRNTEPDKKRLYELLKEPQVSNEKELGFLEKMRTLPVAGKFIAQYTLNAEKNKNWLEGCASVLHHLHLGKILERRQNSFNEELEGSRKFNSGTQTWRGKFFFGNTIATYLQEKRVSEIINLQFEECPEEREVTLWHYQSKPDNACEANTLKQASKFTLPQYNIQEITMQRQTEACIPNNYTNKDAILRNKLEKLHETASDDGIIREQARCVTASNKNFERDTTRSRLGAHGGYDEDAYRSSQYEFVERNITNKRCELEVSNALNMGSKLEESYEVRKILEEYGKLENKNEELFKVAFGNWLESAVNAPCTILGKGSSTVACGYNGGNPGNNIKTGNSGKSSLNIGNVTVACGYNGGNPGNKIKAGNSGKSSLNIGNVECCLSSSVKRESPIREALLEYFRPIAENKVAICSDEIKNLPVNMENKYNAHYRKQIKLSNDNRNLKEKALLGVMPILDENTESSLASGYGLCVLPEGIPGKSSLKRKSSMTSVVPKYSKSLNKKEKNIMSCRPMDNDKSERCDEEKQILPIQYDSSISSSGEIRRQPLQKTEEVSDEDKEQLSIPSGYVPCVLPEGFFNKNSTDIKNSECCKGSPVKEKRSSGSVMHNFCKRFMEKVKNIMTFRPMDNDKGERCDEEKQNLPIQYDSSISRSGEIRRQPLQKTEEVSDEDKEQLSIPSGYVPCVLPEGFFNKNSTDIKNAECCKGSPVKEKRSSGSVMHNFCKRFMEKVKNIMTSRPMDNDKGERCDEDLPIQYDSSISRSGEIRRQPLQKTEEVSDEDKEQLSIPSGYVPCVLPKGFFNKNSTDIENDECCTGSPVKENRSFKSVMHKFFKSFKQIAKRLIICGSAEE
ncbi:hypothetical protein SK128_006560 [Halocaridina rubra]|uniref:Uncharacterized protein n=1 Tax=Halocaridina rubra TaxID=373956 RepID=A0AAN8WUQ7_HALRR